MLSLVEIHRYNKAREIFYNADDVTNHSTLRILVKYFAFQRSLVILFLFSVVNDATLGADQPSLTDAYIVGDVVKIPVLSVGVDYYSLDLQLIPNTDPAQLKMIAAAVITLSDSNVLNASIFANNTLTIPKLTAANSSYKIELELISVEPSVILQLSKAELLAAPTDLEPDSQTTSADTSATPPRGVKTDREKAKELFERSIAQNIIQSKCISCHRMGGYAGGTSLLFKGASSGSQDANIAAFESLLKRRGDGLNYILRKVSGNGHGGGRQLAVGSANYNELEEFLTLLSSSSSN